jgi:hypothetical protein
MLWSPKFNNHNYKTIAFRFITYYNKNRIIHVSDRLQATEITTISTEEEGKSLNETVPSMDHSLELCAA